MKRYDKVTVKRFLNNTQEYKNSYKPLVVSIDTYSGYEITYTVSNIECVNGKVVLSNTFDYSNRCYRFKYIFDYLSSYEDIIIELKVYSTTNLLETKYIVISRDLLDNCMIYENDNCIFLSVK